MAPLTAVRAGHLVSDPTIALTTCRTWPGLSASDRLLATELERSGIRVTVAPWNDDEQEVFRQADLVVLRSNWDFHHHLPRFRAWLDSVESTGPRLRNPGPLVRWGLDKRRILSDLLGSGLRIPALTTLDPARPLGALDWADARGLDQVVVKPAHGASGFAVELVERRDLPHRLTDLIAGADGRPLLMQEYLPEIVNGEYSLVFFDGRFSHAFVRTPAPGDYRVNGGHGGTLAAVPEVDGELVDYGAKVAAMLPSQPLYLRVDLVGDGGGYAVMEVEVNEPGLGLDLAPGSARRFADALAASLP